MYLVVIFVMLLLEVIWQVEIFDIIFLCIIIGRLAVGAVAAMVYSRRTFVCLHCGESFRMEWYELFWEQLIRDVWWAREKLDKDGVTYRRVWVKCPHCKIYDCGIELKQ